MQGRCDNTKLSQKEIKKAYRTLSKKYHPDKNKGDDSAKEKFIQLTHVFFQIANSGVRSVAGQGEARYLRQVRRRRTQE